MRILADDDGSPQTLRRMILELQSAPDVRGLFVLGCDANAWTPEAVDPILQELDLPVFGGVFPALVHEARMLRSGVIVAGLSTPPKVHCIEGLSDPHLDYEELLDAAVGEAGPPPTLMVLVDGLATRIAAFIEALYSIFGLEINYVGGGAGSLERPEPSCLLTSKGLLRDCAVLAELDLTSGVGVSHGWSSVEGPFKVTQANHNRIVTLDWEPALDIYRRVVERHSGRTLDRDHFFELARSYPFGIATRSEERIVRDPIRVDSSGALVCVGEVQEGAFVDILHGDEESLVAAAGKALRQARQGLPSREGPSGEVCLFMDCISRVLFLGPSFSRELQAVSEAGMPLFGACTIGEIANSGRDFLEFYNKTSVVAVLEGR